MPAGPPKSHDRLLLVKRDPERAACAQFYFVFAVKLDERFRSLTRSINYASYIGICQANNRITTAIPTSRAIEFQQPLPLFVCHMPLSFRSALRFCLGSPQGTRSLCIFHLTLRLKKPVRRENRSARFTLFLSIRHL